MSLSIAWTLAQNRAVVESTGSDDAGRPHWYARRPVRSTERIYAIFAAFPLAVWTVFHLWEQWVAFEGREVWLERARSTSSGALAVAIELVVIVAPLALWISLGAMRLFKGPRRSDSALAEERGPPRILGRAAPIVAIVTAVFLISHIAHFWLPKVLRGADEIETWAALTHELGTPPMLVFYAVGLSAVAFHLASALPAALSSLGLLETRDSRRSALLVSSVFALCIWILSVQLTGWLATGTGTFWPIEVVEAPLPSP